MRVYLDANIFIYAIGRDSRYREPCRQILTSVVDGRLRGETSVYTVQEVARQRQRLGDRDSTSRARAVASICAAVHAMDRDIVLRALEVVDGQADFTVSDAIHAVTALTHGITALVSADSDFDSVAGIERVDPLDRDRLASLTGE